MIDASRIAIISGSAPHQDPWHALAETSAAVADVLAPLGTVHHYTTADLPARLDADLLVINVGADLGAPPFSSTAVVDRIAAHHFAGRPLLALHSSVLAFPDDLRWSRMIGGRWVPGVSSHPQIGFALIQPEAPNATEAPWVERAFEVYDERYCALEWADVVPLAAHTEDGMRHPLIWWRGRALARGAVAYDALGHGVESYEYPGHREWLTRATAALLASAPSVDPSGGVA